MTTEPEKVLQLEYEQLNQWARHGEEAAHRIFNFYVSLLTAVLGAFLLITQLIGGAPQTVLLIGSAVCGLLVIVGVTFLDALVCQYIRNVHYRIGIEKLRASFRRNPEIADVLSQLSMVTLEADAETVYRILFPKKKKTRIGRSKRVSRLVQTAQLLTTLPFPVSTQQIFISMVTSLLLGALAWSLVWGLAGIGTWTREMLLASSIIIVLSFVAQNVVARTGLQELFNRLAEISADNAEPLLALEDDGRTEHRKAKAK
ncbi:MAG: hypothetical protein AB8I69_04800 [Anaerolineae bacterium]|jgi:hypothetical protein